MLKLNQEQKEQLLAKLHEESILNTVALEAFNTVDKDKNGAIDIKELQDCMYDMAQGLGVSDPDPNEIVEVFIGLDTDRNKTIDFNEFKVFVKKGLEKIVQAS